MSPRPSGSLRDPRCVLCAMSPTHPCCEHEAAGRLGEELARKALDKAFARNETETKEGGD